MLKFIKALVLSLFFVALAGLQNANAITCANYYKTVSCDGITVAPNNIYGDPTGAVDPEPVCFAAYDNASGEFGYYIKYYHITSCDTSQGYNATPSTSVTTVCMNSADASPTNYTFSHCTYAQNTGATCATYASQQTGSAYSSYTPLDPLLATNQVNLGGDMHCDATSTMWAYDTTQKKYQKIEYCTSCPSGYSTMDTTTTTVGSCQVSFNICINCSLTTSQPSQGSSQGTQSASNCSDKTTKWLFSSAAMGWVKIEDCNTCNSGFHTIRKNVAFGGNNCSTTYNGCTQCSAGTYYDQSGEPTTNRCVTCPAGTYSTTTDASSCTTCPSASNPNQYISSALSEIASVSNGKISQDGNTSVDLCYLKTGTYYDEKGTYRTPACYYNNTERTSTMDCSVAKGVCTTAVGTSGTVYTTGAPYGSLGSGQACWCGYGNGNINGAAKWLFITLMGQSASSDQGGCATTCTAAFCANTTNGSAGELLGCD